MSRGVSLSFCWFHTIVSIFDLYSTLTAGYQFCLNGCPNNICGFNEDLCKEAKSRLDWTYRADRCISAHGH